MRAFALTAALLAGLALPALAQSTASHPAKPVPPAAPVVRPPTMPLATSGKKIDINSANEAELATLPGIGPATAKAIVQGRPWETLADLMKKKVMAKTVYDRDKDRFALANVNSSSASDMAKTLPGIGDKTAPKIVSGRPYSSPRDLVTKKVLTEGQFEKIKDVVTY